MYNNYLFLLPEIDWRATFNYEQHHAGSRTSFRRRTHQDIYLVHVGDRGTAERLLLFQHGSILFSTTTRFLQEGVVMGQQ